MANEGGIGAIFSLSTRPQFEILQKHDQTIEIEPESLSTRVYIAECTDCRMVLKKKPAKVDIQNCQGLVLILRAGLVSGTLTVTRSSNISINVEPDVKVSTITADGMTDLHINLLQNEEQIESIYSHQSSNLVVTVCSGIEKKEYTVDRPADAPDYLQFISHWADSEGGVKLVTEKVLREGAYPMAEGALKAAKERDRQNAEKAFNFLEREFFKSKRT